MILLNHQIRPLRAAGSGLAFACLLATSSAHAGRPMTVDDAAIVDPGQCQLETYGQRAGKVNQYWITPACNAGGTWELAAGAAWGDDHQRYGRLQAKTVFKPLDAGGWGVGLVLANQFQSGRGLDGDLSANVPVSFSLRDDNVLLHLNAGVLHAQATRRANTTWGVGGEFKLDARNSLTAETFGQQHAGARAQLGYAHALIPDQLQLDGSWSRRLARGAGENMITLGLVLQTH